MKKKIIKKINELIIENDPMDLISSGAPDDEYMNESSKVAALYTNTKNVDDFKKSFAQIFIDSFGLKPTDEKCKELEKIGETIYKKLKNK